MVVLVVPVGSMGKCWSGSGVLLTKACGGLGGEIRKVYCCPIWLIRPNLLAGLRMTLGSISAWNLRSPGLLS